MDSYEKAQDRYAGKNNKRVFYWLCKCKCGHIQEIEQQRLKHPTSNRCCLSCSSTEKNLVDHSGEKFNFITIISRCNPSDLRIYKCKCDCGNEFEEIASKIANGGIRSCGQCGKRNKFVTEYKQQRLKKLKPGDRFTRLEVIKELEYPLYECKCDCGKIKKVLIYDLVNNKTKSCGCYLKEIASKKLKETVKRMTVRNFKYKNINQLSRLYLIPQRLKKNIKIRDDNKCVLCKTNENLIIHHIIPYQEDEKLLTQITNLITICKKCHYKAHDNNYHGNVNNEIKELLQKIANDNTEKLDKVVLEKMNYYIAKARDKYNEVRKVKSND